MNILESSLLNIVQSTFFLLAGYLPRFITGFIILFIGLIVASLLRDLLILLFAYLKIEKWFEVAGIAKKEEIKLWPTIVCEIFRWFIIFIFLMSAVEIWQLPKVGDVLNQLLSFIPNVIVAIIIGWIGIIVGRFAFDIVRHGLKGIGYKESIVLGNAAKYAIVFFTVLIILNQLGVAAELVKILFTGIISMLALSFGLAFGLGGQDEARQILKSLRERLNEKSKRKK